MEEKPCSKCKLVKQLSDFSIDKSRKTGRYPSCKSCMREYAQSVKKIVMSHYGEMCVCCGEDNIGFLTIDHSNDDGWKELVKGLALYQQIIKNGFPSDLRVMCWNCNSGRYYNGGVCPHESVRV